MDHLKKDLTLIRAEISKVVSLFRHTTQHNIEKDNNVLEEQQQTKQQ